MTNQPIIFIDSGLGGISTLASFLRLKNCNIIYFADIAFAPYGNKHKKQLSTRLIKLVETLIKKHKPSGFVIACNTATTTAIKTLRKKFPSHIFIGTEPAINLAIKHKFKSCSIFATSTTIKNLKSYKNTYKNKIKLKYIPLKDFAGDIEQFLLNKTLLTRYKLLNTIYRIKYLSKSCECLVLGCTHYVLIKDIISNIVNQPIFDGNMGVSNNILRNIKISNVSKTNIKLVISSHNSRIKENYKKILKQILANSTKLC